MSETKVDLSKVKPKKAKQTVTKLDLSKKKEELKEKEDAVQEQSTDEVPVRDESEASEKVLEENVEATNEEVAEQSIQQEVSNTVEAANEALEKVEQTGQALPENIQKLVDFVNDTGGSVEDYVKLNRDYEEMDNKKGSLLKR